MDRKQNTWIFTFASLVLWISDAAYGDPNHRIYRSASFLGRGHTGIAIADMEEAIFYNPAGLARGEGIYKKIPLISPHLEFSQSTRDLARQLSLEGTNPFDTIREQIGSPNHFTFNNFTGIILRRAALGAFASSDVDLLAYKSPNHGGLEVVEARAEQNVGATFTLAEGFFDQTLLLGATAKWLKRGLGELEVSVAEANEVQNSFNDPTEFIGTGQGMGGDVGMILRGGGRLSPSLGVTVKNIGDTVIIPDEETNLNLNLKQTIDVGLALSPGTKTSTFHVLLDIHDVASRVIKNDRKKIHLGAEINVADLIGLSGGINQGYPTFGVYTDIHFFRVDLGVYTEEVGERVGTRPDKRYFFRIEAGL